MMVMIGDDSDGDDGDSDDCDSDCWRWMVVVKNGDWW